VPAAPALLESPSAYYFSSGDWLKPFDRKHSLRPGRQATITDITCRLVLSIKSTLYTSIMTLGCADQATSSGMTNQRIRYTRIPGPPARAVMTKMSRTMVGSMLKYSARPPLTPATILSLVDRISRFSFIVTIPFLVFTGNFLVFFSHPAIRDSSLRVAVIVLHLDECERSFRPIATPFDARSGLSRQSDRGECA
jgi:hypothetical protein